MRTLTIRYSLHQDGFFRLNFSEPLEPINEKEFTFPENSSLERRCSRW